MRVHFMVLLGAVLVGSPALAQATPVPTTDQAAIVGLVQKAAVRALNFDRGDLERLRGARDDFTPEGWREFELCSLRGSDDRQPERRSPSRHDPRYAQTQSEWIQHDLSDRG